MLRVTLLEDYGKRVRMAYGYETTVPMQFGPIADPALMVDFRGRREPLPARQNVWHLDFANEDERSTLMDPEVAIHYFGNPNAAAGDDSRVRDLIVPEFNAERLRVASVWGDYLYSDRHGHYTTVRIAVPEMPKVRIVPVNANAVVIDSWEFLPHEFWRFHELLDPNAEAEMEAYRAKRRPQFAAAGPAQLDIANLSDKQLEALLERIDKATALKNSAANLEARQKVKAANGG